MGSNFLQNLLSELEALISPIETGLQSNQDLQALLLRIGWRPENMTQVPLVQFAEALAGLDDAFNQDLLPLIETPPSSLQDVPGALGQAGAIVNALARASNALSGISGAPSDLAQIGEDLLGLSVVQYLTVRSPVLVPLLSLLTLIEQKQFDAVFASDGVTVLRDPVQVDHFNIAGVGGLLSDPLGTLKAAYGLQNGLTQADQTADLLFPKIAALAQALRLPVFFGFDPADGVDLGSLGNDRAQHMLMVFIPVGGDQVGTSSGFGVGLALDNTFGLVVSPFGELNLTETVGRFALNLTTGASLPQFAVTKQGVNFDGPGPGSVNFDLSATLLAAPQTPPDPSSGQQNVPAFLVGSTTGTRLEVSQFKFDFNGAFTSSGRDFGILADIGQATFVLSGGDGDGFLSSVLPASSPIKFNLGIGWSTQKGLYFVGGASFDVTIPVNLSIADILNVQSVHLTIGINGSEIDLTLSTSAAVTIGPVTASVDRLGLTSALTFPKAGGNLGPFEGSLNFHPPTGLGIAIDSGPVSGGGALTFDPTNSRYFGAIELSVYSVSVKAFGIIETKLPTGPGYSFLIIISAEFTPIQLGLGFTLNGVGGLIGINRSVDSAGLLTMIKSGQLDNVLFPDDVVDNAPTILNDVETLFPPTKGHYIFGPLAKIGWGTPTLVDGELGLIIEYPGPTLTVIGTVHAALPTQNEALVELNLDVGGVLDFPNKKFSLDASLHDSHVGDFPVSGDMAMRMNWGQNPNFAIAIGGFNPHYNPPAGFPKLKPVTVDLGVNGNPSVTLQGYLALTSNTAQVGAQLQASASKDGAHLTGFLGFDAIFVFSPFSFQADIDAGVHVDFHGCGFGMQFHGTIAGPSPWTLNGQVCVSIIFYDACVGFSLTLGGTSKPTLPGLDPWFGSTPNADGTQDVPGLQPAIANAANWGGNPPAGSFASVTLVAPPPGTSTPTPVDPLGSATLRQKAVPLDLLITSFAGTQPKPQRNFDITSVQIGQTGQAGATTVTEPTRVQDYFAPAQFQQMKDAQKLSSQSFVQLDAGFTISSDALTFGTPVPTPLLYTDVTFQLPTGTPPVAPPPIITVDAFGPTTTHVTTVTGRSAGANGGLRGSAMAAFVDPTAAALITLQNELYTVANITNLVAAVGFPAAVPRPVATSAIDVTVTTTVTIKQTVQVVPTFFLASSSFVL
jgi:hypothetical protein